MSHGRGIEARWLKYTGISRIERRCNGCGWFFEAFDPRWRHCYACRQGDPRSLGVIAPSPVSPSRRSHFLPARSDLPTRGEYVPMQFPPGLPPGYMYDPNTTVLPSSSGYNQTYNQGNMMMAPAGTTHMSMPVRQHPVSGQRPMPPPPANTPQYAPGQWVNVLGPIPRSPPRSSPVPRTSSRATDRHRPSGLRGDPPYPMTPSPSRHHQRLATPETLASPSRSSSSSLNREHTSKHRHSSRGHR